MDVFERRKGRHHSYDAILKLQTNPTIEMSDLMLCNVSLI